MLAAPIPMACAVVRLAIVGSTIIAWAFIQ